MGEARFRDLKATKFQMVDEGPFGGLTERGKGKYVWDIAEAMHIVDAEPGDVVVISIDEDVTLVKSRHKFDTKVAGVISTDPKFYMRPGEEVEKDLNYRPIALAGMVKCKVTTENGAIKKGDLLVSSSLPGYAMRADPEQITSGMVLGSAMEKLDKGTGIIHILVN